MAALKNKSLRKKKKIFNREFVHGGVGRVRERVRPPHSTAVPDGMQGGICCAHIMCRNREPRSEVL